LGRIRDCVKPFTWAFGFEWAFWLFLRCACRWGVIVWVVNDIPAVLVMADVAARTVPDDHAPGLGPLVPAERPRTGAVGLDAVERVDGAVVPFDAPRGVLAVGAALDEGRDQTYRLIALPHDGTPLESITNACSIIA